VTAPKLTAAQRRILEGAARHMFGRIVGGDARMRERLASYGYVEADGYGGTGPLFKITDAGRRVVADNKRSPA
jgi:hypothetical protein